MIRAATNPSAASTSSRSSFFMPRRYAPGQGFAGSAAMELSPARPEDHDELLAAFRGRGLGERLVVHSFDVARNLGFEVIGRVPDAIDGEAAVIYWRRL